MEYEKATDGEVAFDVFRPSITAQFESLINRNTGIRA